MTPKEKAKQLVNRYGYVESIEHIIIKNENKVRVKYALICVDELIEQIRLPKDDWFEERLEYLEKVKEELHQL